MPKLWNPTAENLSRDELRVLQLEKLRHQLIKVYEASPYYRTKFDQARVNPHAFDSLDRLRDYPFFDKEEERISQEASRAELGHPLGLHVTCDPTAVRRISSSSGTTIVIRSSKVVEMICLSIAKTIPPSEPTNTVRTHSLDDLCESQLTITSPGILPFRILIRLPGMTSFD